MRQREPAVKDKAWLAAVHRLEACVLCHAHGIQAAHRNQGKGTGMKNSDCLTAALCPSCHHEIDNAPDLNREQRRARLDHAILLTIDALHRRGWIHAD